MSSPVAQREPSLSKSTPVKTQWRETGFWCLLVLAVLGYFAQSFTPLRMAGDTLNYLTIADSVAHGHGFTVAGVPTLSPWGYPAILALMIRLGVGHSWCINLLNVGGIVAGLAAVRSIAGLRALSRDGYRAIVLACLFSFVMIKHAAIPMTDLLFFGITLAAMALAEAAAGMSGREAWVRWALSLLLAAIGLSLRVAGITGLLVVLFECVRAAIKLPGRTRIFSAILLGFAGIGVIGGLIAWETRPNAAAGTPVVKALGEYRNQPVTRVLGYNLLQLGQVVLNFPQSKVPGGTPLTVPGGFLLIYNAAALAVVLMVGLALFRTRRHWTPTRTFLLCYSAMIFLWPQLPGYGVEPRLWLPVLPLVLLEIFSAAGYLSLFSNRSARWVVYSYAACYVSLGIVAMGYSMLLTASPRSFVKLEMIQPWRNEYEVWLFHRPVPAGGIDPHILSLLHEFGGDR